LSDAHEPVEAFDGLALRFTEEGLNQSMAFFNQAIAIDPNYALAYAGWPARTGL
jgi:hypothetical protein